ncbi:MAG: hypothetical protein NC187_00455 [Candidatus Amulumruptor caecigallinarius]|nr:hypothetical protein [Candidatus Amulumruptor caecigallinarius]MCM1395947.1 hypothetical protein [Candidatus Amulumruptor caecigallinarius]MCM1452982.1 hypothetical protein [bacterium]
MTKRRVILEALGPMKVGDKAEFPISQIASVRTAASEMGIVNNRKYATVTHKREGVIAVHRTA